MHVTQDTPIQIQLVDRAPLFRVTGADGGTIYLNADEILVIRSELVSVGVVGSLVYLKGRAPEHGILIQEVPNEVYRRASSAQRRL